MSERVTEPRCSRLVDRMKLSPLNFLSTRKQLPTIRTIANASNQKKQHRGGSDLIGGEATAKLK